MRAFLFWVALVIIIWAVYWNISDVFTKQASIVFTIAAAVIMMSSLSSFYLPTRFFIDDTGVGYMRLGYHRVMNWRKIRSVVDEKFGLFVSPFPVKSRLENYRGMYLYYRGNHEDVIAAMHRFKPDLPGLPPDPNSSASEQPLISEDEGGW